ncbi:GDSL-type esterase/lipase family protein [Nocardioides sp. SYSU D00038]|uniref:SGNH/GDSL hydrolase family protein n=1 Tax=Nocardioides sp. SYSU D00038 TaxID=2812554 RepID=UPI001968429F|nr:GDSL-type esterase/lipase family protein [Nocardioides sp. SYSU D00038]
MLLPVLAARRRLLVGVCLVVVAAGLSLHLAGRASSADADRCERFAAAASTRAERDVGTGERVVVIGDSWSVGLGLERPERSWPSQLPGRVHVDGFSGSGFSAGASPCGAAVAFAARAAAAVAGGAGLVVVEGGLNDVDQPERLVARGFRDLLRVLDGTGAPVVVVGPAAAPSRSRGVPRIDALLAELSEQHGVAYVSTTDLDLSYLDDRLHLTEDGHRAFGAAVAARLPAE